MVKILICIVFGTIRKQQIFQKPINFSGPDSRPKCLLYFFLQGPSTKLIKGKFCVLMENRAKVMCNRNPVMWSLPNVG